MKRMAVERKSVATLAFTERETASPISAADGLARLVNRRRTLRVVIDFPVTVFGQNSQGKIFAEDTNTVTVNAHGALLTLKADIDGQKPALLANPKNGTQVQCRVVYRKEIAGNQFEIGLEFACPYLRFWGMNFPPEDWDPAERKKTGSHQQPISTSTKGKKK
jgi:hypothetical protein